MRGPIIAALAGRVGSDRLKREFLAPSIAGDVVSCLGVSEPGSGSDVASIKVKLHQFTIINIKALGNHKSVQL